MNKQNEALEIGSLFQELNEKGFGSVSLELANPALPHAVSVWAGAMNAPKKMFVSRGGSLVEALANIVDQIREHRGEPTRAQEVEALLAKDAANDGISMEGKTACLCGSTRPLIVDIPAMSFALDWGDALDHSQPIATIYPASCKIGRCPECGQHHKLAFCST